MVFFPPKILSLNLEIKKKKTKNKKHSKTNYPALALVVQESYLRVVGGKFDYCLGAVHCIAIHHLS